MLNAVIRYSLRHRGLVVLIALVVLVYGSYAATMLPIPSRQIASTAKPNNTAAQPIKTAAEYKFVTGGRPSRYMRKTSPNVCTTQAREIKLKAEERRAELRLGAAEKARSEPTARKKAQI